MTESSEAYSRKAVQAHNVVLEELTTVNKADFPLDELVTHIFGRLQIFRPDPSVGTAEHSNTLQLAFGARHAEKRIVSSEIADLLQFLG